MREEVEQSFVFYIKEQVRTLVDALSAFSY